MPAFAYTAVTPAGQSRTGNVEADDRGVAIAQIEQMGLVPVDVAPAHGKRGKSAFQGAGILGDDAPAEVPPRVSRGRLLEFTRQLGNLLAAGVPLSRALDIICRETSHAPSAAQWKAVRKEVVGGTSLADAMASAPRTFPPVYLAMVRAGEAGGFLDVVLRQIADFLVRDRELRSKLSTALIYPLVLALIAAGVVTFLLAWFIPRFSAIFDEFGQSLPLLTKLVQGASFAVRDYGLFVLLAITIIVVAVKQWLGSPAGRRAWDDLILKTPGVGAAAARFALVRFSRMLGTLIGAGVPLISALKVAKEAVGNQTLSDALDDAAEQLREGTSLSQSLARCPQLFPASVVEMIAVAEESGRLSEELIRMAGEFESDLDRRLRVLVSLAEPLLLMVMAALVGTIVVGMLLPVFDLWDAIQ
ncbi:MAG: type II secretion system F family protein [Planctomycetota bacterium]